MKALSLWQPWASLLACGRKLVETRSWPIRHRGPLLVHAAKKWDAGLSALCVREPFKSALECMGIFHDNPFTKPRGLPFGAIIGRVDVVECYPTDSVELTTDDVRALGRTLEVTVTEHAFGDYSPDRFAFLCRNPTPFPNPIPCVGRQGLFNVPDSLIEVIR